LAFVAVSVNVYPTFEAYVPVAVTGLDVPEVDNEIDGLDVAVIDEIAFPPVAPAVKARETTVVLEIVAVGVPGACGTVVAVIALEAEDVPLLPAPLEATTVNV
jgi:hypothetical protein